MRVVADVRLEVRGFAEPIVGHLISAAPRRAPRGSIAPCSGAAARPIPRRPDEVLVSEALRRRPPARARRPRWWPSSTGAGPTLRVAGVVLSPEFVFAVRAAASSSPTSGATASSG